jgi:CheY-like chemotaxis protein
MTIVPDALPLKNLRVMIVEDEALVAMLLEDMLADMGCVVAASVSSVAQALTAAETLELDVAILDMNLAGKPVLPVAELLAQKGTPFIFASGYGEMRVDGAWGERPMIQKPFSQNDVEMALRRAVGHA